MPIYPKKFENFKSKFLVQFWEKNPEWGTHVGYYKYVKKVNVYNAQYFNDQITFCKEQLTQLKRFKSNGYFIKYTPDSQIV